MFGYPETTICGALEWTPKSPNDRWGEVTRNTTCQVTVGQVESCIGASGNRCAALARCNAINCR